LAIIWGAGLVAGYVEYASTYSSEATVWVHRAPQDLGAANPDEPNLPLLQTSASQQADLLNQLLQTKGFLRDVVRKTALGPSIEPGSRRRSSTGAASSSRWSTSHARRARRTAAPVPRSLWRAWRSLRDSRSLRFSSRSAPSLSITSPDRPTSCDSGRRASSRPCRESDVRAERRETSGPCWPRSPSRMGDPMPRRPRHDA